MELYEVLKVNAAITLSIQMCLLRTRDAVMSQPPLRAIASHPAALAQITRWKTGQGLDEQEDPDGTSEAARKLAGGLLPDHTGVIGPGILETLFPQLMLTATGIQDKKSNTTLFGQLQVTRRPSPVSSNVASDELEKVVEIASTLSSRSSAP